LQTPRFLGGAKKDDRMSGKVAIVTGAAGGMGAAAAKMLSAQGLPLILCDLKPEPLERLAADLRSKGSVETLAGDVADPACPARLAGMLKGREIAALIHTAGVSPTMADGSRIVEVNFHGTMRLLEGLRPHMADGGCAVVIASMAGHMVGVPEVETAVEDLLRGERSLEVRQIEQTRGAYALSKRAVTRLVSRQAQAFAERGARIMSLSPGVIDTDMGRAERASGPEMDAILELTPLKRMGTSEEIAAVAVFLCSPAASYMTGSDVRVDGGSLAGMGL
jgi:NAD(P)-dependent dehydrogenase (short-subunit alcohol dehydrogenase family)